MDRVVVVGYTLLLLGLGCDQTVRAPPAARPVAAAPVGADPREAARAVLQTYCGDCHHPEGESPKPEAMAIFDLARTNFESTMSAENFEGMLGRLDGFGVPPEEQVTIRTFVEATAPRRSESIDETP